MVHPSVVVAVTLEYPALVTNTVWVVSPVFQRNFEKCDPASNIFAWP